MDVCRFDARPAAVRRSEENDRGGLVAKVIERIHLSGEMQQNRKGFVEAVGRFQEGLVQRFMPPAGLPMTPQAVEEYLVDGLKLIELDPEAMKAAGGARRYRFTPRTYNASLKGTPVEASAVAMALETYIEATGAGVRLSAENLLRKIKNGEEAMVDAIDFARKMDHIGRLGAVMLGGQQQAGRTLMAAGDLTERQLRGTFKNVQQAATREAFVTAKTDVLSELGRKLNDPELMNEALEDLASLAQDVMGGSSPSDVFRISSTVRAGGGMWQEAWVNGLMSSPSTPITNLLAGAYAISRPFFQLLPASATSVLADAMGMPGLSKNAKLVVAESIAEINSFTQSMGDAMVLAWHAIKTEEDIYRPLVGGSSELVSRKAISATAIDRALESSAIKRAAGEGGALSALAGGATRLPDPARQVVDGLGGLVRVPSRLMLGTDTLVKHLTVRAEVSAAAIRDAVEKGVDLEDAMAMRQALTTEEMHKAFNFDAYPDTLHKWSVNPSWGGAKRARQLANEMTFQEDNRLAEKISETLSWGPMPLLRPFIPFVKTPLNILKQGVDSTPLGLVFKAGELAMNHPTRILAAVSEELARDPARSYRYAGQISFMTTVGAVAWHQVMTGQAHGGGPGRWAQGGKGSDAQRTWEARNQALGIEPYTIFGVPLDRFGEPFAMPLRMIMDAAAYSGAMDQEEQDTSVFAYALMGASALTDATFLRGLNEFVELFRATGPDGMSWRWARGAQNYVATQMPFGGLLNFLKNATGDPFRQMYRSDSIEDAMRINVDTLGTSLLGKVASRIPGVGTAPILMDQVTGLPVPLLPGMGDTGLNPLQLAVPVVPRGNGQADKLWADIYRVLGRYTPEKSGADEFMTAREKQQWNQVFSSVRLNGRTFSDEIRQFVQRVEAQYGPLPKRTVGRDVRTTVDVELSQIKRRYKEAADQLMAEQDAEFLQRLLIAKETTAGKAVAPEQVDQVRQLRAAGQQMRDTRWQEGR